jgi:hypothetical protein
MLDSLKEVFMNRRKFIQALGASGIVCGLPKIGLAESVKFSLHNKVGQKILLDSLNDPNFWSGVKVERSSVKLYDEFKLKPLGQGYLTHVSGEGQTDFTPEQVVLTVLHLQDKLPKHMSGATAMPYISKGMDKHFGVEYTDMLFLGDMDFFYCEYYQRMYRYDLPDGRTICAFEKMDKKRVGEKRWNKYLNIRKHTMETVDFRWMFNDIVPVTEVFGMYIVEPGDSRTTRVTLTAKLRFGTGTGLLAQWGSEIPYLVRSGTLNGFDASVAIAKQVKKGNYKR